MAKKYLADQENHFSHLTLAAFRDLDARIRRLEAVAGLGREAKSMDEFFKALDGRIRRLEHAPSQSPAQPQAPAQVQLADEPESEPGADTTEE